MKSSGSLVAGVVLPEYYAHHANYHVKTMQAYEAHGLYVNYRRGGARFAVASPQRKAPQNPNTGFRGDGTLCEWDGDTHRGAAFH